jgi:hypothetical protein
MNIRKSVLFGILAMFGAAMATLAPESAQDQKKPNILFIMGDDIGLMQPSINHEARHLQSRRRDSNAARGGKWLAEQLGYPSPRFDDL